MYRMVIYEDTNSTYTCNAANKKFMPPSTLGIYSEFAGNVCSTVLFLDVSVFAHRTDVEILVFDPALEVHREA